MPNYIGTQRKTSGSFTDLGVLFGPLQRINHSQGHAAGDAARCALTNVCRSEVRHVDYFSQFGNGEFAALLPDTTKAFTDGINQKSIVARSVASSKRRNNMNNLLFEGLLEAAPDGIVIADASGKIVLVNAKTEALFGYRREELIGQPVDILLPEGLRAGHPDHRESFHRQSRSRLMGTAHGLRARRKDGAEFAADISLSMLTTPDGLLVTAVVRDISDIMQTERELRRLNRMLQILSRCSETLVRSHEEVDLLQTVCRHIVETGDYLLAWIGFALHDGARTVRPIASAGANVGILDQMRVTWGNDPLGRGPVGEAIREGRPSIARDLATHPDFAEWHDQIARDRLATTIALPLHGKGGALGVLNIYAVDQNAFEPEEVKLLLELASDLAYGIRSLREVESRERFERELGVRDNYDSVTGLPNAKLCLERLHQAVVDAERNGGRTAAVVLDLNRFNAVKESLGHASSRELLKHMGQQLSTCLREGDTVARLSGDEFAVVMHEVARPEDIEQVADRLLKAVAEPFTLGGHSVRMSASAGVSVFPVDGINAEILLRNAETAAYSARSRDSNSFHFFSQEMNEQLASRLALVTDLRRAIECGELVLHFQPQINLARRRMEGAEALVRWQHPVRGLLPPAEFIPAAEECGLILPLGDWVVQEVCRQVRSWLDAGLEVPGIAVNLSSLQFSQPNLVPMIVHALKDHQLDAKHLQFEITESVAMHDMNAALATLRELNVIGLKLALDDFGTGYSSLAYLKRFPIDHLKIDRVFVRDLTTDPDDAAICIAIINLAHNLKLSVIAEGVETEGQMNFLRRHGCDNIQGYYFSRPVPADQFVKLLGEWSPEMLRTPEEDRPTLLIVDDELSILSALKRMLRREGYRVLSANSAQEGFEVLATNKVQVILSDQRMPIMNGTEFLSRVCQLYPDTIRIVLSGYTDLETVTDAINRGAIYKFLTKPWDDELLREQLREAFRHQELASRR